MPSEAPNDYGPGPSNVDEIFAGWKFCFLEVQVGPVLSFQHWRGPGKQSFTKATYNHRYNIGWPTGGLQHWRGRGKQS